jgi:hypothetical protein
MTETDSPEPAPEPAPAPGPAPDTAAGPPPHATPFVPRYREPWINPAKRTPAILLGVASAVVLLALGLLIGLGLGGGGGHRHEFGPRMQLPGSHGYGRPGQGYGMWRYRHPGFGGPGYGPRHGPGPASTPAATPVPSSSHR